MSCSLFSSTKLGGTVDTTTCMSSALTTETCVRVGEKKDQNVKQPVENKDK